MRISDSSSAATALDPSLEQMQRRQLSTLPTSRHIESVSAYPYLSGMRELLEHLQFNDTSRHATMYWRRGISRSARRRRH
jgi:hypothetical protein